MKFISELLELENRKIVLASQSPRRIEMLRQVGLEFEIHPAAVDEKFRSGTNPVDYVRHNASEKAHWAADRHPADLLIAADTVVTLEDSVLEKPGSREDAAKMLRILSGRTHQVITGFCLLAGSQTLIDNETTRVTFYDLSEQEIEKYLESGEPFDKAGAYGIQGLASLFVRQIEGCYFNVVGFPLGKFYQQLKKMQF